MVFWPHWQLCSHLRAIICICFLICDPVCEIRVSWGNYAIWNFVFVLSFPSKYFLIFHSMLTCFIVIRRHRKCVCMCWECVHRSMCGNVSNSSPFGASGIPAVPAPSTPLTHTQTGCGCPLSSKFQSPCTPMHSPATLSHSSWALSRLGGTKC